jgi:hypothetical protein
MPGGDYSAAARTSKNWMPTKFRKRQAMQTLISVFDSAANARKAMDRLAETGFSRDNIHLHQSEQRSESTSEEIAEHDRGVLDSIGHVFVSLFGEDDGRRSAEPYHRSMDRGHSVVIVDANSDHEAEVAAVILHEQGAIEVDDRDSTAGEPMQPGVRAYKHNLRDPLTREESAMAERAGQVTKELKEDREERAYAAPMTHVDRDRPK